MPEFSFYYNQNLQGGITKTDDIDALIAYVQSLGGNAGVERANNNIQLNRSSWTSAPKEMKL